MSVNDDKEEILLLRLVNDELTNSLARCRFMLNDCKAKLAANSNDALSPEEDEDTRLA